ncbi:hypothetical protein, partial [Flaviaesturariibacter amylovorans]|uniref:hypothetical protein n=1 Tax=Flaviaesturariibacter amylovorans TaxID=1084520 RepID=UPI0031EE9F84
MRSTKSPLSANRTLAAYTRMQARNRQYLTRTLPTVALLILLTLLLNMRAGAQPWTYDFGTGTGSYTTASGAITNFFTATPTNGGTYRIRAASSGNVGSGFVLANPGTSLGTNTELQINASATGSTQKFTVYGWTGATNVAYAKFNFRTTASGNGVLVFKMGANGANYSDANAYNSFTSDLVAFRLNYAAGVLSVDRRISTNTYTAIASPGFSKDADQLVEVYANNNATSATYYRSGTTYTLSSNQWDLWVGGVQISPTNGWPTATLASGTAIAAFGFYGESSTTPNNNAFMYIDDLEYSNALPATPAAGPPTIAASGGVVAAAPGNTTNAYNGNTVTLTGTNLESVTVVKVGGSGGTNATITAQTATTLTFTMPAGTLGNASGAVYVQNSAGNATSTESLTNLGYITTQAGDYNTGSTWLGGAVPIAGNRATIAHTPITMLATAPAPSILVINSSTQLTLNSGSAINVTSTLTNGGTIAIVDGILSIGTGGTFTNNGTVTWSQSNTMTLGAGSTLTNNGTFNPGNDGRVSASGALTVNGTNGVTFAELTLNGATTFTTQPTINKFLTINDGASILTNAPVYAVGSTLRLLQTSATTIGSGNLFWTAGSSGAGVPRSVSVVGAGPFSLTEDRSVLTSMNVSAGTFTNGTFALTIAASQTSALSSALQVSGGSFNLTGGTVSVGPSGGGNQGLTVNGGTLTVSGGTLNINGNIVHNSGTFAQSGGTINVDGNGASSVPTSTPLVAFNTNTTLNLTGGTLTIVDPHAFAGGNDHAFRYTTASNAHYTSGAGHTFQFGNGTSSASGGSASGFFINTWSNSGRFGFGNLVINNSSGTNRLVTSANSFGLQGSLTITAGELSMPTTSLSIAGNIANNGTLTLGSSLFFQTLTGSTPSAVTSAQTVSGSGTFRNASSSPTGNFANITFQNTTPASPNVTFNIGNITITGTVTHTAGIVSTSNNDLSFGSAAIVNRTAGYYLTGTGQMKKTFTTTGTFVYHLGETTATEEYSPLTLGVSTNSTSRTLGVKVTDAAHPNLNTGGTAAHYLSRYWTLTDDATASITYSPTAQYVTATDVNGTAGSLRTAVWNGAAWTDYTTTVNTGTPSIATTGITAANGINNMDLTGRAAGATQLAITSISPNPPTAGATFSVTVQAQDGSGTASAVSQATSFTLTVNGYGGSIGGTVTGTIASGATSATVTGVTLSSAGTGAQLTATQTSGDALTAGNSATFNVLAPANQLVLVGVPSSGNANSNVTSFTVEARRPDGTTVDNTYTGTITITKVSGPGTLGGTTSASASAGVATFGALQFTQPGTYTISATAPGLTDAPASGNIVIAYSTNTTDAFRSVTTGNWGSAATWESSPDGTTWYTATAGPASASAGAIEIRNGHTVTVAASVTTDQLTVASGGVLTVNASQTLTFNNGAGTDLTVAGTLNNNGIVALQGATSTSVSGTWNNAGSLTFGTGTTSLSVTGIFNAQTNGSITNGSNGPVTFGPNSQYNHTINAGVIPTATWDATSTVTVTGMGVTRPTGMGQLFGNFTWNNNGQSGFANVTDGSFINFRTQGLLNVVNTGGFSLTLVHNTSGQYVYSFGAIAVGTGAQLTISNSSTSSAGPVVVNVAGDVTLTGTAILDVARGNQGAATGFYRGILTIGGNLNISGSARFYASTSSNAYGLVLFNGSTPQTYTNTSSATATNNNYNLDYVIASGATVNLASNLSLYSASATFYDYLNNVGTLNTGTFAVNNSAGSTTEFYQVGSATVNTSFTLTSGNVSVTSGSITGIEPGMLVTGTGIPAGTYVTGYVGTTGLVLTKAATTTGATALTFTAAGGKLITANTGGIASSGATGAIQTGLRDFSSTADYTFNGTGQNTGTFTTTPTANTVRNLEIAGTVTNTYGTTLNVSNLTLTSGTFTGGSGRTVNIAAAGTLTANGGNVTVGSTGGTINFAGAGTIAGTSAVTLNNVTVNGGAISLSNANTPTIGGTLLMANAAGSVGFAPIYGAASTLQYGVSYTRGNAWSSNGAGTIGVTPGYPNNVTIAAGTFTLNNGAPATPRALAGNLTVNTGTTFNASDRTATLTVGGDLVVNGTFSMGNTSGKTIVNGSVTNSGSLSLGSTAGGDLDVYGSWTRVSSPTFTDNGRTVSFLGSNNASITAATSPATFSHLVVNKTGGAGLTLNDDVNVGNQLHLTEGTVTGAANFTLASEARIIRSAGALDGYPTFGAIVDLTYSNSAPLTAGFEVPAVNSVRDVLMNSTADVTLADSLTITGTLTLTSGNLNIAGHNLYPAAISGGSAASYVKTSGAGALVRLTNNATFPVGNSTFNPLDLAGGPSQNWRVRVQDAVTGVTNPHIPNIAKAVQRQWHVTPATVMPVPVPG